jgi:hypothetical protein
LHQAVEGLDEGVKTMSGTRRDSGHDTRGNNLTGRGSKSTDDNKKAGGGHGKHVLDDNASPPGQ